MRKSVFTILLLLAPELAPAAEPIALPKPHTTGGKPLMETLQLRQSGRAYSAEKLSPQVLSNLLWAGWGINRPDGHRTAPTANNRQALDVYAVMADGVYLYDAKANRLVPVASEDARALTGSQDFVGRAPLNLVYVSDLAKEGGGSEADKLNYAFAHTGFVSQNVYLYCASEGLATVVRASVEKGALAKAMRLKDTQRITLVQTVGYPAK